MPSDRTKQIDAFLASVGWAGADRRVLADDASFRRYDRLRRGADRAVLMDAPPDKEDTRPFVAIARLLADRGFSVPEILAEDTDQGFLLLEDLGDTTYTRALAAGGDERALYELATDVLIALHRGAPPPDTVPAYSDDKFLSEAALVTEWTWPALKGVPCPDDERERYLTLWRNALSTVRTTPAHLVLRDFHVDNLMRLDGRNGIAACGLLDFQDAVAGPVGYDLVSLLEDVRRDVGADVAAACMDRYLNAFKTLDEPGFRASCAVLGAQRAAKIVGLFIRLDRRDGKPGYLRHIPRTWRRLENGLRHPALDDLRGWFDTHFPPNLRTMPEAANG